MLDMEPDTNEFRPIAGEGSVVVQRDGTIGSANERAARAFGLPVHRFVGARLHDLAFEVVDPDARPLGPDRCPVALVFEFGSSLRDVELGIRTGGETTWWWLSCQPLVDEAGAVAAVSCTLTPVVAAGAIGDHRRPMPVDEAAGGVDLEALARLAGLTVPDVAPTVPESPWARTA